MDHRAAVQGGGTSCIHTWIYLYIYTYMYMVGEDHACTTEQLRNWIRPYGKYVAVRTMKSIHSGR